MARARRVMIVEDEPNITGTPDIIETVGCGVAAVRES